MTKQNPLTRLEALEMALQTPKMPRSICRMSDGSIKEIKGLAVLLPFLDGKISSVVCDDADTANLMRAMDTEKAVDIEIAYPDGDAIRREKI